MNKRVRTFYGPDVPARVYQREDYETLSAEIVPSSPTIDEGVIDWYSLREKESLV